MMSPGSGDLPVGQLDAQKRLPKGRGTPSLASSAYTNCDVRIKRGAQGVDEDLGLLWLPQKSR